MSDRHLLSRRTLLQGVGASLALPWLEVMGQQTVWGNTAETSRKAPNRFAVFYVPNGVNMADWKPKEEGANFELPAILEPLKDVKNYVNVLTGLTADKARSHGDGGGDHARAMAAFLTGAQPRKTDGSDFRAGLSADQAAASRIGDQTRLASLEIGIDPSAMAGNCDSGYSCVYNSTISWRSATSPLPKLNNPKLVFERLFGSGNAEERARRDQTRRSILDFVRDESTSLQRGLGANDRRKLDEYFTAIRDVEQRILRARQFPPITPPNIEVPQTPPTAYEEHLRLLADLMILAFQTDTTRVSTFVFANEGSNRSYPIVGVNEGHHELSHHENNPAKLAKIRTINLFHMKQFAYILDKMKSIQEGDGNLLDHSMLVYGSGNSDGNRHNHDDLPILLAGKGCGTVQTGRHIRFANETPLNNLWLSMLDRMDCRIPTLGDSTGKLQGLS